MTKLRFSDGMEFEMSGPPRAVKRSDGWYVVGDGFLIPVDSYAEATKLVAGKELLAAGKVETT
jgi:hypothetical protein